MTDLEKIRLIIQDKTAPTFFTDDELTYFLTSEASINLASAAALESWAAAYALNADNEHIGDYSYAQSITKKMMDLAAKLRKDDAEKPSITWAEPNLMMTEEAE